MRRLQFEGSRSAVFARLKSPLSALAIASVTLVPMQRAAATPPEVPAAGVLDKTLRDLLRNSDFQPSELSHKALAEEGKSFDLDGPVIMQPRFAAGEFQVVGEVAVLEGDSQFVTDFGNGQFGLRYDNARQDPMTIADKFITQFGDQFDFIVVWTAFWDYGADGLAYYVPILQDTFGLGDSRYDQRRLWGSSTSGKLQGFLNMKSIEVYGNIRNPANYVYPVMGQEFSHRWLAQMKFARADGSISTASLGRDAAHWSTLLQADGSVQDGNTWQDNGDGTFSNTENMVRYSPLDLYGMGIFGPEEVPDFFLIEDATYRNNNITGLTELPVGARVRGTRTNITIDDVIAANGARRPVAGEAQTAFRMAVILVTRPGETAADVADQLEQIETFRTTWEAKYSEWTYARSTMCTRVTANCDRAALKISQQSAREVNGDGDDMPEPGEQVAISLTIENGGGGVAVSPQIELTLPAGDMTAAAPIISAADIPAGGSQRLDDAFIVTLGPDAACGQDVVAQVKASTEDMVTQAQVTFPLGYNFVFYDDFSTDQGWQIDAYGSDTAQSGRWERSAPSGVSAAEVGLDFQTQPESDVAGNGRAFVTGAQRGQGLGGNDIDDGVTSVVSPSISLADTLDPKLSYFSWRTGLDFNAVEGEVHAEDNDVFTVELSPDEGVSWVALDSDISNDETWAKKEFRVLDAVPSLPPTIRLRFTARDIDPQSLSEAAFDNVRVWDLQPSCYDVPVDPEPEPADITPEEVAEPGEQAEVAEASETAINPVRGKSDDGCVAGGESLVALGGLGLLALRRRRARRA